MSDSEEEINEIPEDLEDDGDDLFGDAGDEEDALPDETRIIGSDDDDDDDDAQRARNTTEKHFGSEDDHARQGSVELANRVVESVEVQRHRIPKPKDGTLRSLRIPKFVRVLPEMYDRNTFEPTEADMENARAENPKAEVRVRKDPATGRLHSNALIHRWSDGSMTISIGDEHFEFHNKQLAPPQNKPYQELQDAHYYAAAPNLNSNHYMMVGHVSEQYTIKPGKEVNDDALAKLAERMAAASRGVHEGDMIIKTFKDPELAKRQAEQAERERMKVQRKKESAAAKQEGGRYGRSGALSLADLEGGRKAGGGRKRGAAGSGKPKRRRPEYDSDDDLPSGARRAGDDYDLGDDFIAPSDDDFSEEGAEEEEELLDDDEDEAPRRKRQRTADEDNDADGDLDDEGTHEHSRSRRRQIIDDDEDED